MLLLLPYPGVLQVSAFASALSFGTTINGSIFFNGPRAGINWNDGAGGGNNVTQNLLFNWVRETSDRKLLTN